MIPTRSLATNATEGDVVGDVGERLGDDEEAGAVVVPAMVGAASSSASFPVLALGAPLLAPCRRRRLLTVGARSGLSREDRVPSGSSVPPNVAAATERYR